MTSEHTGLGENGGEQRTVGYLGDKIPLREGQIEPLFTFIAKGLLWHHWRITLTDTDCAAAIVVRDDGAGLLNHIFTKMPPPDRVAANLADGALIYGGIQVGLYANSSRKSFA